MSLSLFLKGWRRRSAAMLDVAGCSPWLTRWRCPKNTAAMAAFVTLGRGSPMLLDVEGISAEKVQAAIDRLREMQE